MQHALLTFSQIMQTDILYFDSAKEDACHAICNKLSIDNMPDIDGEHYYFRRSGTFIRRRIPKSLKLFTDQKIFSTSALHSFRSNPNHALFVFEGSVLTGISHITDYNLNIVLQAIQADILCFERKLRELLVLHNFNYEDLLKFHILEMEAGRSGAWHERCIQNFINNYEKMSAMGPLRYMEFGQLLSFAASDYVDNIFTLEDFEKTGLRRLTGLRNTAMHSNDPVRLNQNYDLDSLYDMDSFEKLFRDLEYFRKHVKKLNAMVYNHPDYKESITLDNSARLDIIYAHFPKALEYYLGRT